MAAFLVHGVPDTHRLWDGVREHLSRKDVLAPDMPGFDRDAPAGFGFTKEDYLDWLIADVERAGRPVDIVGHDWGASSRTLGFRSAGPGAHLGGGWRGHR
jgi:pimeloyl-ACP methyl ester carboxylesterase